MQAAECPTPLDAINSYVNSSAYNAHHLAPRLASGGSYPATPGLTPADENAMPPLVSTITCLQMALPEGKQVTLTYTPAEACSRTPTVLLKHAHAAQYHS